MNIRSLRERHMQLTKLEHACVRLERTGYAVIDPAVWSIAAGARGGRAVLVTHDTSTTSTRTACAPALTADPGLQLLDQRVGGQ